MPETANMPTIKKLLSDLVAIPSITSDIPACRAALEYVARTLHGLPLHVTTFEHDGHPATVYTTRPTRHPKVLLLAHLDVAPAPDQSFRLIEHGEHYLGRGVLDMKFAAAVFLRILLDIGPDLSRYDLGLMLTTDEEPGGRNTTAALIADGWRADVVINADAGYDWQMEGIAKGRAGFRIHATGASSHSSRPWLGDNALVKLINYLKEIESDFTVEPCGDPDHAHDTLSINVIEAGHAPNQVPASATAAIEFRIMPGRTADDMAAYMRKIARRHPGITTSQMATIDPLHADQANHYLSYFRRLIEEITGIESRFSLSHGATDSIFFVEQDIPVVMVTPPGANHHGDQEWVDIAGVEQYREITRRFLEGTARIKTRNHV